MRRAAAAVAAALTLAIAAGCGGDPRDELREAPAVTTTYPDAIAEDLRADTVDRSREDEGIVVYGFKDDPGLTVTYKDGEPYVAPPAAGSPELTEEEPRGPGDITTGEQ